MEQNRNNRHRLWKRICLATIVFLIIGILLMIWTMETEREAHYKPDYSVKNIDSLLYKPILVEADYQLLFQQTGLGKAAVDFLRTDNRQQELLTLQEIFFANVAVECEANTIITKEERIKEVEISGDTCTGPIIPYLEAGDILITFNCHAFGWRNGHAAMVVDSQKRLTLEARVLGTDSAVMSMSHWERYPSFAVLRLKEVSEKQRAKIAEYAAENLIDVPYRLEAGIGERAKKLVPRLLRQEIPDEGSETMQNEISAALSGTHCAHLIWYAYQHFGYDLDSDGGIIVTPRDIYESPHLEIVQIYGMPKY